LSFVICVISSVLLSLECKEFKISSTCLLIFRLVSSIWLIYFSKSRLANLWTCLLTTTFPSSRLLPFRLVLHLVSGSAWRSLDGFSLLTHYERTITHRLSIISQSQLLGNLKSLAYHLKNRTRVVSLYKLV